ncbi:glycosyltransferase family 2 protein [Granulicella sp. L46]|uniref:glycosyltransferase n=1 Tax=Granulicella sp. L46 TaxID=1641865 RepID=UPI00131BF2D9|nr:glycosyltransferase family 2 protein [Granulicella sp. L46]
MKNSWHISVLIPARDEEELLPRCLQSVLEARSALAGRATCDVIVAVDRSMDGSFEIARTMLGSVGAVIRSEAGIVGVARAMAAKEALRQRTLGASTLWLANTDADCWVPRSWLADQLKIADSGVEAVAGTIDVDSFEEHEAHVPQRFRSTYLLHPDGTHPHVHGANLGVRADAYLRAGGWADLRTAEDHDLWARLRASGARTLSPSHLRVVTSGRRVGRAPMGFAGALAAHNEVTLDA